MPRPTPNKAMGFIRDAMYLIRKIYNYFHFRIVEASVKCLPGSGYELDEAQRKNKQTGK